MAIDISTKIDRLKLKNPVMVSSGTFGYIEEYSDLIDVGKLGAVTTKTITLNEKQGNPPPRIIETASGIINSIGLENVGLDRFITEKLPYLKKVDAPVIVSIAGQTKDEYAEIAKRLDKTGISAIEINVSCPNVRSKTGFSFGQNKNELAKIVKAVRRATSLTLITKLSPNVTNIREMARTAEEEGSNVISLVNSFLSTVVDIEKRKPKLGNFTGGLSGPAIKPIALRMVYEVADEVDISVIGEGGIMNTEDAIEFLICGADAISVGTANFIDPKTPIKIIQGIKNYMKKKKLNRLSELVGSLKIEED